MSKHDTKTWLPRWRLNLERAPNEASTTSKYGGYGLRFGVSSIIMPTRRHKMTVPECHLGPKSSHWQVLWRLSQYDDSARVALTSNNSFDFSATLICTFSISAKKKHIFAATFIEQWSTFCLYFHPVFFIHNYGKTYDINNRCTTLH